MIWRSPAGYSGTHAHTFPVVIRSDSTVLPTRHIQNYKSEAYHLAPGNNRHLRSIATLHARAGVVTIFLQHHGNRPLPHEYVNPLLSGGGWGASCEVTDIHLLLSKVGRRSHWHPFASHSSALQ